MNHLRAIEGGGEDGARNTDASVVFYEELDPLVADLRAAIEDGRKDEARLRAAQLVELANKLEAVLCNDPA